MIGLLEEYERTMAFAEVALGQIRSLRQNAVPRNYEIWYIYATGYNSALNKIINETLARNGKLTEADLEQIYETYLSQHRTTERIDTVGTRVSNEIDDVMNGWTEYLSIEKERQLKQIIEEENLNESETRRYIENSFREGEIKTTGTDIDKLLPPVSRFGGSGRAEKKQNVIDKLLAFFEKFFGLTGYND